MKLNPVVKKFMAPEYVALWQVAKTVPIKDASLRRLLTQQVQNARYKASSRIAPDQLAIKLQNYGNTGGWGLKQIQQFASILFQDKAPAAANLGDWLSVEIELLFPNQGAEASFVSFVRKSGYMQFVTIKDDGSVKPSKCDCPEETDEDGNGEGVIDHVEGCKAHGKTAYGREIVVTFKVGDWDFLRAICHKLNSVGSKVNKSCGLHVHFDMRHMKNERSMMLVANRVAKVVPALKQMLPASRQQNEFCEKVINKLSDSDRDRYARYSFVNVKSFQRHRTLEIRGHSGTTDANKIINWIKMLRVVMNKPNRSQINTVQEMLAKFKFEPELQEYMLTRQAKFLGMRRERFDDVAVDNEAAESVQGEIFTIAPAAPQVAMPAPVSQERINNLQESVRDMQEAMRYALGGSVTINGQEMRVQVRPAITREIIVDLNHLAVNDDDVLWDSFGINTSDEVQAPDEDREDVA